MIVLRLLFSLCLVNIESTETNTYIHFKNYKIIVINFK